jgi:molecular chaperone DnaK
VEKAKNSPAWQQLSSDEIASIESSTHELKASLTRGDYKVIRQAIEDLDKHTRRLAEIMMDSAVAGSMKGQTPAQAGQSMGQNLGAAPSAPHAFAPAEIESEPEVDLRKAEHNPETPGESTED